MKRQPDRHCGSWHPGSSEGRAVDRMECECGPFVDRTVGGGRRAIELRYTAEQFGNSWSLWLERGFNWETGGGWSSKPIGHYKSRAALTRAVRRHSASLMKGRCQGGLR